jgi:hypothetical protein
MKRFLRMTVAVALLAGCAMDPPRPQYAEPDYSRFGSIRLDVRQVYVVPEYKPPFAPPNVEHLAPITPLRAAESWGRQRLQAVGSGTSVATLRITDARITETPLPRTEGARGLFTRDQTDLYEVTIELILSIRGEDGRELGYAQSRTQRSRSVPENITYNDREKLWHALMEQAMLDLNGQMERQIRGNLGSLVR